MSASILVADDDFDNRTIVRDALQYKGYRVLEAKNGREVIALAVKEKPDMIFMDLSMPELSGWEAAKQLRLIVETRAIPIVAFTAHAMQGDKDKALESGCDDYLSKPCLPSEVISKAECWIRKGKPSA